MRLTAQEILTLSTLLHLGRANKFALLSTFGAP